MPRSIVFDGWIMSSLRQKSWLRSQSQGHHRRMEPTLWSLRRIHSHRSCPCCGTSYLGLCCNLQHQELKNPLFFSLQCDGLQAGTQQKPQGGQRTSGNLGENVLPGPHTLRLSPRLIQSASASSQIKIWAHLAKYSSQVISCILGPSHLATAR